MINFKLFWRSYQQKLAGKYSLEAFTKVQWRFWDRWQAKFCRISTTSDFPGKKSKEFNWKWEFSDIFSAWDDILKVVSRQPNSTLQGTIIEICTENSWFSGYFHTILS